MIGVLNRKRLDSLVYLLEDKGIMVSRHSYSYRLFYKGKIIAGIHVYPIYNEISIRLYRVFKEYVKETRDLVVNVVKQIFPEYRIKIEWYPPNGDH